MRIKLNTWQTYGLFLPFMAAIVMLTFPNSNKDNFQANFAFANFLMVAGLGIIVLYQTLLARGFAKRCSAKSNLYKWNALIPVLFFSLYLLYVIYFTFINPEYYNHKYNLGPLRKAGFRASGWIIFFFFTHASITFYFVNNQFVSRKIKLMADDENREKLTNDFLIPMKRLTRASIYVASGFMVIIFIMIKMSAK